MNCRYCDAEYPDDVRTCQRCGATLRAATMTALRLPGEFASLDPSVDASIKPALAQKLDAWAVSSRDARLAIHLMGRNYPLGRLSQLRALLEEGLIRPDTPVLHQKRGRWYEAARFPGIVADEDGFRAENTGQFDDKTPGMAIDEAKPSTVEGRAVLAARLGREAEEAASAGELERAISIYEEVVQINPRYPLVKKRLRQLKATLKEVEEGGGEVDLLLPQGVTPARFSSPADDPDQHDELTAALSVDDLVDGEVVDAPPRPGRSSGAKRSVPPPPPPPTSTSSQSTTTPAGLVRRGGMLSHGPVAIPASLSPKPAARGLAQPIDPDEDSVVTAQEEVLEPTVLLDERDELEPSDEQEPLEPTHLLPLDAIQPPDEAAKTVELPEEHTAQELVFEDTPVDAFGPDIFDASHGEDPFQYVRDAASVDWAEVVAFYGTYGEAQGEAFPQTSDAMRRLFAVSQRFCLLYTEGELIGGIRVITDGVAVATLCDLALAPVEPVSIVAASLIAAALKDLDVPTVVLLAPPAYVETMKMLDFDGSSLALVRRGATS